jgi:hypothetical protein
MSLDFTPNNPPKAGKAAKLWTWYTQQTGAPPKTLTVVRPRQWRFEAGAARYIINGDLHIYNADDAATRNLNDAFRDPFPPFSLHLM